MNNKEAKIIYEALEELRAKEIDITRDRIQDANRMISQYSSALHSVRNVLKKLVLDHVPMVFEDEEMDEGINNE